MKGTSLLDIYLLSEQTRWMPQKKAKKTKAEKSLKPTKTEKSSKNGGLGGALKKGTKSVGKAVGLVPAKLAAISKKSIPLKVEKTAGKSSAKLPKKSIAGGIGMKKSLPISVKIPAKAPAVVAKKLPVPPIPAALLAKGKKEAPKALKVKPEGKGKKAPEVVVVVPAPKGVALLTKEGKKKGKSAADGAVAKKNRCREPGCDVEASLLGYCRMHYIKNWRRIKRKEAILASGQLNNYVEELVNKYPDKYLDVIRQDLATEKEWGKVVVDLELEGVDDDSGNDEDIDSATEGARSPTGSAGGGRGDFDDEGDTF